MLNFFKVYGVRKFAAILNIVVAILSFSLFFVFFNSFSFFLEKQKTFLGTKEPTSEAAQLPIFYGIWIILCLLWLAQIVISILIIFNFIKSKSNADLLLKILFYIIILIIIGVSILLSFQPQEEKKYINLSNGKKRLLILKKPSYLSGWLIFLFNFTTGIVIIISKKNFGYLPKYKIIKTN